MVQETTRFLSYICPECRQSVIVKRDLFTLAAAPQKIRCPCGHSSLYVDFQPYQVRMKVPCLFCGREHNVTCSTNSFIREKTLAFSCAASGLDCCYVGEEGPVYVATARLEKTVDKLNEEEAERGEFLDPDIMEEVLGELRDIAARNGISCTCGSRKWTFRVNFSSVDLLCRECGAEMRIPAATAEDLENLCCRTSIVLHGRNRTPK